MKRFFTDKYTFEEYEDDVNHTCERCGEVYIEEEGETICCLCRYEEEKYYEEQKRLAEEKASEESPPGNKNDNRR